MPTVRRPHDGFTSQEKVATARFIELVGVGTSDENRRRCRLWWKDLSDMQNAGVVCTLIYQNAKFNKYCKTFPRRKHSPRELIDTIVSWEKVLLNGKSHDSMPVATGGKYIRTLLPPPFE
jgi:hypothetical protein